MDIRKVTVLLVVFGLVWCCEGKFIVETSELKVSSPDSLKGTYDCAIGNFGIPDYGGSMAGTVVYPTSNQDACLSFKDFNVSFSSKPGGLPTFLLADRGDCYFTLKAWHAQTVGAAAVLVADDRPGPLLTMDPPADDPGAIYLPNITIPSVLINMSLADDMKKSISGGKLVKVNLDWSEALPHPDGRVEYEFWTNSNDECGPKCETQTKFVQDFKGAAQILEQKGYTQFTPHYITWYCPDESRETEACKSQCINKGRYCAPDPEGDLSKGYEGKEVVVQNLREACFFKVVNESGKPWLWWDFVSDFITRCPMKDKKFNGDCAARVIHSLGVDLKKVDECVGDTEADADNPILDYQQEAQIGRGSRGDVKILPTLVINNRQYRGKLERRAVLKAICSGFQETTEPAICLNAGGLLYAGQIKSIGFVQRDIDLLTSRDIETNQCLDSDGGCWEDKAANVTACRDTFRGRVCECPTVQGVKFVGDGYTHCEASGPLHCTINNGGCWKETRDNQTYSACAEGSRMGCECPPGFKGDGLNCEDVDECKEKLFCHCPECKCKDKWGGFDCSCSSGLLYIRELDTCIRKDGSAGSGWSTFWIIVLGLAAAGAGGYLIYKYRLRRFMDSEIRAIMAQYMPLDDNHGGYVPISSGHGEATSDAHHGGDK